jgi:hypothetical protein
MSDSTNDTSAIDEKRKKDKLKSSNNLVSDIRAFIISVIHSIIVILLYFSSSGIILFICKLAQSNILPTEADCFPYTNNQSNIEKIETNIFTTTTTDKKEMSMKLEIPNDRKNTNNGIIEMFKNYKEKSDSNFLANYLISIIESLMQLNYSIINRMSLFNSLPESVIILILPPVLLFICMFSVLLNLIYFVYLWFANMNWFFKTNTNNSGKGPPQWQNLSLFNPFNIFNPFNWIKWWIGFWLVIIFMLGFVPLIIIPFLTPLYCIISCLFYEGKLNGKTVSPFSLIIETIKHYKVTIVLLISYFVISTAFSKLGQISGIFSIITILLIYFGRFGFNIFKPIPETNLSDLVSNNQATRETCSKSSNSSFFGLSKIFGGLKGNNNMRKR